MLPWPELLRLARLFTRASTAPCSGVFEFLQNFGAFFRDPLLRLFSESPEQAAVCLVLP